MKTLVTVGASSAFNFIRLLEIIDELCDEEIIESDELLVQANEDDYTPRNYTIVKLLENDKLIQEMKNADLIIAHGGTGTVTTALKMNKKTIVFPRRKEYGELIDNHQLDLCNLFRERNYLLVANDKEELVNCIQNIDNIRFDRFESNTEKFIEVLIRNIEN